MAFLLLLETLYTFSEKQVVIEFNALSIYLSKLDIELQHFRESSQEERLETLDASLAANIIQSRLKNVEGEINDLEDMRGNVEAKERKGWCL